VSERRFEYRELAHREGLAEPDETTMDLLWRIVDQGVLGASRHVELAHRLLIHLANPHPDALTAARRVSLAGRFVSEARGRDAPIVANAIGWLLARGDVGGGGDLQQNLSDRAQEWYQEAQARRRNLVGRAVRVLSNKTTLIAFDYSSTVAAIVLALHEHGLQPRPIVPESRAIAGGRRYLEEFLSAGIDVSFALDVAMDQMLEKADAVLLGCESIRADGSFMNTVGSLPLAKLAKLRGVSVYACADLYKLDTRSYAGEFNRPTARSFDHVLLAGVTVSHSRRVDTSTTELEVVMPELVTSFLTEFGPVPPFALWSLGRQMMGSWNCRDGAGT